MKEDKMNITVATIIFMAVIAFFIFITINRKDSATPEVVGKGQENMQQNIGDVRQIDGLKITVLQNGSGNEAKIGDIIAVNYTGKLADGTIFDSNVDPKFGHTQPFVFTIGKGEVIKGWELGVAGMKEGEKRMLEISPEYAYGSTGAGGVIPPGATINFEVELLQIKK